MFGSGVPTAEKPAARRFYLMSHNANADDDKSRAWSNYQTYVQRTSILVPLPPALYTRIPSIVKKTLLLDLPMYHFKEDRDGPQAVEEEERERLK
jgi:hypothetical protein